MPFDESDVREAELRHAARMWRSGSDPIASMSDVEFLLDRLSEARGPAMGSAAREAVACWMIAHGYATGHGDTLDDLLGEMEAQASRRPSEADVERVARALCAARGYDPDEPFGGSLGRRAPFWTIYRDGATAAIAAMFPQAEADRKEVVPHTTGTIARLDNATPPVTMPGAVRFAPLTADEEAVLDRIIARGNALPAPDNNDGTRVPMSPAKSPTPVAKPPATPLSERSLEALRRPWKPGDGI